MCGIAGQISYGQNAAEYMEILLKMQATLLKRGPDQRGIYTDAAAGLVHARLSVVDIEHGKQPMSYTEGNREYVIVYNGELYNTEDIRKELVNLGHRFDGHSDTEVVLHSYIQWQDACVHKFNGIFAFAVWEKNEKRLFIARDRMGVKPFFYTVRNEKFIFGSELKTLLVHPEVPAKADIRSLAEIMFVGPGRTPGYGVFVGIDELPPACWGVYSSDGLKIHQYWRLEDREHRDNFEETAEKVRYLVTDSIKRQLVSDVPVGTFLSGGLDSSLISSVADREFSQKGQKLHTFSVDYVDNSKYFKASHFQPNSDEYYIDVMSKYLNGENHRIIIDTPELADALFEAVDARDLPGMADVDSSLLIFCREIKKNVTVMLSGECADEIFGGYPWYRDKDIREKYGFPWAQSTAFRLSFLKDGVLKDINAFDYVDRLYRSTVNDTSKLPNLSPLESRMKEMVTLNYWWFMQTLLDRKDRMSMYNGLEVRVPFCDYRIAEYLYSVPWEYKDYEGKEKGLLRYALRGYLPDEVLWRKKSPYPKTHNPAYMSEVSRRLMEAINDNNAPILQFIKKDKLEELVNRSDAVPWYGQLMTTPQTIAYFLQINYWLSKYKVSLV